MGKFVNNGSALRVRCCALTSASVLSLVLMGMGAKAQPSGGTVAAGQAQISAAGANTLINQTSSKAIINWQSFSVSQGSSVQFNQPNASAITLNRVTGTSASTINGSISANGQVWLLNPNGLLFGNGAAINVGGLLATTSDIADQDFLSGRYNFTSTGGNGGVTNNGTITASKGGSVVLSSPSVANTGIIWASTGHVVLGGTDTFTVDFTGDHLLSYAISANSAGGKVLNSGKIAAAGGSVLMTARAAQGLQDAVVNNTGMVEATSVRQENGEIILEADNGTVSNSGTLNASGTGAGQTGGTVKMLGAAVAVADGAVINVSGDAGGGTAMIGGNLHGAGPEPNAQNTTVGKATINANAIKTGNGGTVAVYSTGNTQFAGTITAQGGIISGNGGMVETSGHNLGIDPAALVTTAATHGIAGNWLLDPDFIDIQTCSSGCTTGNILFADNGSGTDTVDPSSIVNSLNAGSDVLLQANKDITVSNQIVASSSGTTTLELDAGRSIFVNAPIVISGTLKLFAGDVNAGGGSLATAAISQGSGTSIQASTLDVTNELTGGSITLNNSANDFLTLSVSAIGGATTIQSGSSVSLTADAQGGDVSIIAGGGINVTGVSNTGALSLTANGSVVTQSGPITAISLSVNASNAGATLTSAANNISGVVSFNTFGDVSFTNGGASTILANINTFGNNLTLNAGGNILQASATSIAATNLSVTAPGDITLNNSGNSITGTLTFNPGSTSNLSFANSVATSLPAIGPVNSLDIQVHGSGAPGLAVNGALQAAGSITLGADGDIDITSAVRSPSGTVNLHAGGNILAMNEGSLLSASNLILQADTGTIGTSSNPPLNIIAANLTAQTSNKDVYLSIQNSGGSALIIGSTANPNIGISAGTGNVTLSLFDTPLNQLSNAPIVASSLDLAVHCSSTSTCASGVSVSLPATGNAITQPLSLNEFFEDTTTFNLDFNNSLPLDFGNPSGATIISGNLTLSTTIGSGAPIVITGEVSATSGVISLNADGDIGAALVNSFSESGVLFASEVDLKSNAGQIGGQTGTAPSYGSLTTTWAPFNIFTNTLTAATNGQNVLLNLGALGEGGTIIIGNGTTGINALGTASTPGDVSLVVDHEAAVGQNSFSPIVAHNLAISSEGGGDGLGLGALGNAISGTVNLAAVNGNIAFVNGTATTLGSSSAGGSIIVTSAGALTVPTSNSINAGVDPAETGNISLTAGGTVTLNGAISTAGDAAVVVDTGGSIFVNANIDSPSNGSGPGSIVLTANDPGLAGNSDSNGIFNGGVPATLTAAAINLEAGAGQDNLSGSIGMAASNPLMLTSDTGALSLSARTYGGNVYVSSALPVSIDPGVNGDGINGIYTASGGTGCGGSPCYGEVFLSAAGPITQTYGIQSGILTLTATGSSGTITLSDTGGSGPPADPGNSVFGQVHLNSNGSAVYKSGFANSMGVNLGASIVHGSLAVISSNGDLNVQDPNGGVVQVTGTTTLEAGASNGIFIQTPLISGSNLSLIAGQNIIQSFGINDSHIQTGGVLTAQSTSGSISLDDMGCSGGSSCGGDPGNQVGAIAVFNAAGDVVFSASSSLTLASVTATNGGKIKITSGGNLTIESGSVLTSSLGSGYSIQLSAVGNFINDAGPNALSMASGADFGIFSAAPGGDVFGGLNSGNAAYWGTTYNDVAGTTPPDLGNRYVFAVQPTLTVSTSSASKVYGVDDGASLAQTAVSVSGLQPGVSGVFLADTVSSVFGTGAQATSLGSAATANVGTYAITLSNNNPANTYIPGDGYAIVVQNGTLTVAPATLTYLANAASRTYGSPNPSFGGTVTGFVNTDTQASSTTGTLSFVSTATANSPAGTYAIDGSGLTAANYVFVQAAGNASALTITDSGQSQINGSTPVLTGFIAGLQPPLLNPGNTPLDALPLNLIALPVVPPPPPPPAAPPVSSPLADNNSEQPTSSDQTTTQVADSLNGNGPPGSHGGVVIIPALLVNGHQPPPPTDVTTLSSFGNTSLWQ